MLSMLPKGATHSTSGSNEIALEMRERLRDASFDRFAALVYFPYEHRALDRRDTEVGHALWVGLPGQLSLGLFFDEERRQLAFNDFENKADVLANQFIIHCRFVPQGSERTTARHFVTFLQFHMSAKPFFQIEPRADFVVDRRSATLNLVKIRLEHFVNETFLAFEVVIELAFSGSRSLDDVIGAGRTRSLLVKQVRCRANDSQAGVRAPHETWLHTYSSKLYPQVQYESNAIAGSIPPFVTSLYLFSVSEYINKIRFLVRRRAIGFACFPVSIS